MRVGDAVEIKRDGSVGLIVDKIRKCVPDGNPNGDFTIEYSYKVACGEKIMIIPQRSSYRMMRVINAGDFVQKP